MSNGVTMAELTALPHSGLQVPHTRLTVSRLNGHRTHDGYAFSAALRFDKKIVGVAQNDGNGGETYYYPAGVKEFGSRELHEFVNACRDRYGNEVDQESVLDALVEEYETPKDIQKILRHGEIPVRKVETLDLGEPVDFAVQYIGYGPEYGDPTASAADPLWRRMIVRTYARRNALADNERLEIWAGEAWETLPRLAEVLATPHELVIRHSPDDEKLGRAFCACAGWRSRWVDTRNDATRDLLAVAFRKHAAAN